jgi:hypothetical protein
MSYQYIEQPTHIACAICNNIPITAYKCKCSSKTKILCQTCITDCDQCKINPKIFTFVQDIINQLQVMCTNAGCDYKSILADWDTFHSANCPYQLYKCDMCNQLTDYKMNEFAGHFLECCGIKNKNHQAIADLINAQNDKINRLQNTFDNKINALELTHEQYSLYFFEQLTTKINDSKIDTNKRMIELENEIDSMNKQLTLYRDEINRLNSLINKNNELIQHVINGSLEKLISYIDSNNLYSVIHADNYKSTRSAAKYGHVDIFNWLFDNGANIRKALYVASKHGQLEIVENIFDKIIAYPNTIWGDFIPKKDERDRIYAKCAEIAYVNGYINVFMAFCKRNVMSNIVQINATNINFIEQLLLNDVVEPNRQLMCDLYHFIWYRILSPAINSNNYDMLNICKKYIHAIFININDHGIYSIIHNKLNDDMCIWILNNLFIAHEKFTCRTYKQLLGNFGTLSASSQRCNSVISLAIVKQKYLTEKQHRSTCYTVGCTMHNQC